MARRQQRNLLVSQFLCCASGSLSGGRRQGVGLIGVIARRAQREAQRVAVDRVPSFGPVDHEMRWDGTAGDSRKRTEAMRASCATPRSRRHCCQGAESPAPRQRGSKGSAVRTVDDVASSARLGLGGGPPGARAKDAARVNDGGNGQRGHAPPIIPGANLRPAPSPAILPLFFCCDMVACPAHSCMRSA